MSQNERKNINILDHLLWDYNISSEEAYQVLIGERERAGHYNANSLFKKLIESFPWYAVMDILPLARIKELLDQQDLSKLRFPDIQKRYEYIKTRLPFFV